MIKLNVFAIYAQHRPGETGTGHMAWRVWSILKPQCPQCQSCHMTHSHSVSVFWGSLPRFIAKAALETIGSEALSSCAAQSAGPLAVKSSSSSFSLTVTLSASYLPSTFFPHALPKHVFSRRNTKINISHDEKMLSKAFKFWTCLGQPSNRQQHTIQTAEQAIRAIGANLPCIQALKTSRLRKHCRHIAFWTNCCSDVSPLVGAADYSTAKKQKQPHTGAARGHHLTANVYKCFMDSDRTCVVRYSPFVQRLSFVTLVL